MFVLDGSGSISYSGFETARAAIIREIRALTSTFAQVDIGVVLFSEDNTVIPIETRTPAQIEQMIQQLEALGHPRLGTELNEAIRVARRALADHSTNAARALNGDKSGNVLVLFTDGQVERNVELASARGVEVASARVRQGVEIASARARQGVEVASARARQGVEVASARVMQGVEVASARARQGVEVGSARVMQGVEVASARARQEVEVASARARQGVEVASAREVQEAQAKGILVLVDTVEEPSRTVQNIAPTVLESRTPINWVDYVACPPTTLDPTPSGSVCRDFYLVVDGSDTVLRFEGTIRQYLAYTALRYRMVDNAIGVNIYGTDANVQARNTRIRLTEDKYQLADDIRQELVFPRSRGAGTNHAITQSIGFLNDDIRDNPAALVLIMNGPPLDIQATAQAIQQARQQGYPVSIIRIGDVSQAEMNQLASGDMTGVYVIDYVTDLFGVNFDSFLCGGGGGCQLSPLSCTGPRVFQQSSCSCVCRNSCSLGRTHDENCQCVCLGQCPAGQIHDSNCLCRCASNCPQGRRQNPDCSCTVCPYQCQNQQFQDPNCACQCRNSCPRLQHPDERCACVCDNNNRPPNANGICINDRECQLSQADCGNALLDLNTCTCVPRCPPNANLAGNTCQCRDLNKRYDSTSNLCVPRCPPDANLAGNTCQCRDLNKRYDSTSNLCVHVRLDQFKIPPPVAALVLHSVPMISTTAQLTTVDVCVAIPTNLRVLTDVAVSDQRLRIRSELFFPFVSNHYCIAESFNLIT
ncbi:micos complex subunit mic12 [Plakobranchus ocellatus]|uniref:Micos complex subunit mic12 n=1 Tax=Plakobranchus ocellatus TaxID=259542 RepID=A0AAV4DVU4_9GAST|nr:micos complex subunit mic12 [Plakobranchus ocellatus]